MRDSVDSSSSILVLGERRWESSPGLVDFLLTLRGGQDGEARSSSSAPRDVKSRSELLNLLPGDENSRERTDEERSEESDSAVAGRGGEEIRWNTIRSV